eukprot:5519821-Karenia_brevis.AAC.1
MIQGSRLHLTQWSSLTGRLFHLVHSVACLFMTPTQYDVLFGKGNIAQSNAMNSLLSDMGKAEGDAAQIFRQLSSSSGQSTEQEIAAESKVVQALDGGGGVGPHG